MKRSHSFHFLRALGQLVVGIVTFGVLGLLVMQTPAPAAFAQTLSVDALLRANGTLDLTGGVSGAVDLRGWDVALDSKRGPVLSRRTDGLDPTGGPGLEKLNDAPTVNDTLAALPHNGLNDEVHALAVFNNALYAGGYFTQTADASVTNLNHIARFDPNANGGVGAWSALPHDGLNNAVSALVVWDNALYVGGAFTQSADTSVTNLNKIARFDGTSWSALPHNGLNSDVSALTVWNNALYVGGYFIQTADTSVTNLNNIARFDGSAWSALPHNGLNNGVSALVVWNNALYVGGFFTQTADASVSDLGRIAKFDGTGWSALPHNGLDGTVLALAVWNNALYAGGHFTQTADTSVTNLNRIAKFDGTGWSALPHNGLNNNVYALAVFNNALYVGGLFSQSADASVTNLNRIARFDPNANGGVGAWSALPHDGLNNAVSALVVWDNALYVGGAFTQSADTSVTNLNRIAKLSFTATQTGPTFTVNTDADSDDGLCDILGNGNFNADCTLREAINAANAQGGANTLQFDGDHTIYLVASLPTLTGDTTLDGGTHFVTLDGQQSFRLLTLLTANTLNVNHLVLADGYADTALPVYGTSGGAIFNQSGTLKVTNSTLYGNYAATYGGAILSGGTTTISNSTLSVNEAGQLGGGVAGVDLVVLGSTFSDNVAPTGAAIDSSGSFTLSNSILANSTGSVCAASSVSASHNLIESTGADACNVVNGVNGNLIGVDPGLGLLGDNGGKTYTMALPALSAAIDAGDDGTCAAAPVSGKDERGITRPFGTHCDMGTYEKTTADCVGSEFAAKPTLLKPTKNKTMSKTKVAFDWTDAVCATSYKITVKNTTAHTKVTKTFTLSKGKVTLAHGNEKWFVQACNANGCSKSATFKFTN